MVGLCVVAARPVYGGTPPAAHQRLAESPFALHGLGETAVEDTAFSVVYDPWLGFDKVQHTTFSLLFVLGSQYLLVNKAGWGDSGALPLSVGVAATLGVAKELYDWRISPYRYFSGRDLVADVLGIAAGIVLVVI
ncbi:MAG TPA: hypothetical protein VF190_01960 [Rhodothermales bacterium]